MSLEQTDALSIDQAEKVVAEDAHSPAEPLIQEQPKVEPRRKYAAPSAPRVLNCMLPAGSPDRTPPRET
ncbi:MAG: hypothetical protein RLO80_01510 [Hyphomonas sp.]